MPVNIGRELIAALGSVATSWPLVARAQQPTQAAASVSRQNRSYAARTTLLP
jgi:hypothetical protein